MCCALRWRKGYAYSRANTAASGGPTTLGRLFGTRHGRLSEDDRQATSERPRGNRAETACATARCRPPSCRTRRASHHRGRRGRRLHSRSGPRHRCGAPWRSRRVRRFAEGQLHKSVIRFRPPPSSSTTSIIDVPVRAANVPSGCAMPRSVVGVRLSNNRTCVDDLVETGKYELANINRAKSCELCALGRLRTRK
jgi:hypothetical protein